MKLILLSEDFYKRYQNCKEILQKQTRPYACLTIKINGVLFAIPFRHHIRHKYAFFTYDNCGLDYTKAVVITRKTDVARTSPQIDQREFNMIKGKEQRIYNGLCSYIKLYKKALQYKESRHYANIIKCSSLQYFEDYFR